MIFVIFHHYFPFQSNSNFMINDFVFISWNQTDKGMSSICDHFVTVQIFPLFFIWQKIWQKIILSHMVMQRSKPSETTRLVLPLLLKCFRKSCFCLEYKKSFTYVHCTVKLDFKELLNKEQIDFKELFTDYQLFYTINLLLNRELLPI